MYVASLAVLVALPSMKIEPLIVSFLAVASYERSPCPVLQVYVAPVMSNGSQPSGRALVDRPVGAVELPWLGQNLGGVPLDVWQSEFGPIEALRYQKPITLGSPESSGWPFVPR